MNKRIVILAVSLIALSVSSSCKRRHSCYCRVTGSLDTLFMKEYRGYTLIEARRVCQTDNNRTTGDVIVRCDIAH